MLGSIPGSLREPAARLHPSPSHPSLFHPISSHPIPAYFIPAHPRLSQPIPAHPIPSHSARADPALVAGGGEADGSFRAVSVTVAESISLSLCLPGIAAGTRWQHPVVLNENCPTSASPGYPTPLPSTVSVCPGWEGQDTQQGPGHKAQPHPPLLPSGCGAHPWLTKLCFTGGLQRMPGSCTGECGNCALPSLPLTVTFSPVPAPSSPYKLPKPSNSI